MTETNVSKKHNGDAYCTETFALDMSKNQYEFIKFDASPSEISNAILRIWTNGNRDKLWASSAVAWHSEIRSELEKMKNISK